MNLMFDYGRPQNITTVGGAQNFGEAKGGFVSGGVLTAAGAAATATIKDGAGTTLMVIAAPINQSVPIPIFRYEGQGTVTLTGAGSQVSVVIV